MSATPIASNTTQYPSPVHDKLPFCCPDIHSSAPIVNSMHENASLVRNAVGRDIICPNIELDLDVLGTGRLAAGSVLAGLSGSMSALGNAVDATDADVGMGLIGPQEGDTGYSALPLALLGEVVNAVGEEGDTGGSEGLGSINEKKLCERECLW